MMYEDLSKFELLQIVRILGETYQGIKYGSQNLSKRQDFLDLNIFKKYIKFQKVLEKELEKIKKSREEDVEDFLYLFPYKIYKKRGRKKKIKISKKHKN